MSGSDPLHWHPCRLVAGHGVASGQAPDSPYPAGTIALQTPCFARHGLDLTPFFPGTLNLDTAPDEWRLRDPDVRVDRLHWSDRHPPETFSFWRCRLRRPGEPAAVAVEALIYHPHPETKRRHFQAPGRVEVLAPWLGPLPVGTVLEVGADPRRCRRIQPARLRARLLEFLKFRVLAAQGEFFADLGDGEGRVRIAAFRTWLAPLWPEALDLSDDDLRRTLEQARTLYLDG